MTKVYLKNFRISIQTFSEEAGRLPTNLYEITYWLAKEGNLSTGLNERISTKTKSEIREVPKIDGTGGWCYNPINGEIRVNLTNKLSSYIETPLIEFGGIDDDIPSSW